MFLLLKNRLVAIKQVAQFLFERFICGIWCFCNFKAVQAEIKKRTLKYNKIKESQQKHFIFVTKDKSTWEYESLTWGISKLGGVSVVFNDGTSSENLLTSVLSSTVENKSNIFLTFHGNKVGITSRFLTKLAEANIYTVIMSLDDQLGFFGKRLSDKSYSKTASIASCADLCLTSSSSSLIKYKSRGALALKLRIGTNLDKFKLKCPQNSFHPEILFIGNQYGHRKRIINALSKRGFNIETYGRNSSNGFLSDAEMLTKYESAKIVLGFGFVGQTKLLTLVKGRDAEVLATGSLYVTSYSKDLAETYGYLPNLFMYKSNRQLIEILSNLTDLSEDNVYKIAQNFQLDRKHLGWDSVFAEIFS